MIRKAFSINFYVPILHFIAVLICNSVLVYLSSESRPGVSERQKGKGGGQLFQGALSIL